MGDKKTPISREDAKRIQSEADRTGTNQEFKARVMRAAYKNEPLEQSPSQGDGGGDGGNDDNG
jgi:hypothetical protein